MKALFDGLQMWTLPDEEGHGEERRHVPPFVTVPQKLQRFSQLSSDYVSRQKTLLRWG